MKLFVNVLLLAAWSATIATVVSARTSDCQAEEARHIIKALCSAGVDNPGIASWFDKRNQLQGADSEKCSSCLRQCYTGNECLSKCEKVAFQESTQVEGTPQIAPKETSPSENGWGDLALVAAQDLRKEAKCTPVFNCEAMNMCEEKADDPALACHHGKRYKMALQCLKSKCVTELKNCLPSPAAKIICEASGCIKPCEQTCRDKCASQCGN